jgi:hypothetical protein
MKNTDTHKVVLPTGDTSGKAATPAFAQLMNLLIRILAKLGLLKEDLDYHVMRASMVIIYFFFGYQKWFAYEAHELIPLSATVLLFPGCTLFSASREPVGFWGFRNGCLARSCSWDSGIKS